MRKLLLLCSVLILTAGCTNTANEGSKPSASESSYSADKWNSTDEMFVQMMIPHHEQAVTMSGLALKNTDNQDLLKLASDIASAQSLEITQMQSWLRDWKSSPMSHMHMGDDGMLSPSEIQQLKISLNHNFDQLFLSGMIRHHQGAVEIAKDELASGVNANARHLAESVVKTQNAEIKKMLALQTSVQD